MTKEEGWNPRDLIYIKNYTADDIYEYLKSSKDDRFLSRLKRFLERLGSDERASEVRTKLEKALTKLAKESAINARRIRYGVGYTVAE